MLTSDLLRTYTRGGRVHPRYIDPQDARMVDDAARILNIFQHYVGKPKGELKAALDELYSSKADFVLWRGLIKLLYDRSEFEVQTRRPPSEIRQIVFDVAAKRGLLDDNPDRRAAILSEAATNLGITAEECAEGLYADTDARQIFAGMKAITPLALVHRYNLALAQAVLYQAESLEITLSSPDPKLMRYVFHALKFHRLMYRARRESDTYTLYIDGPASLLTSSRKYGLQMATFLPALVHAERWKLEAHLVWGKKKQKVSFVASDSDGLVSHYKVRGQWVSQEEKWFEQRFKKLKTEWKLKRCARLVELSNNDVLIPEYVLTAPDGRQICVEIIGFWRLAYLQRRLEQLTDESVEPFVLVVSDRLKTDRDKLEGAPPEVVFFKGVILPDKVIQAAEIALSGKD